MDLAITDFEEFVKRYFLPLMKKFDLVSGSLSNGVGDKVVIKKNKHGFYSCKFEKVEDNL